MSHDLAIFIIFSGHFSLSPGIIGFFCLLIGFEDVAPFPPFYCVLPGILVSCLLAFAAHQNHFRRYRFNRGGTPLSILVCSLLFVPIGFYRYASNRSDIVKGKAVPRSPDEPAAKHVFEWIAIPFALFFLVLCAIAIPSSFMSRTRANEAVAVTCLRNYHTAQNTRMLLFGAEGGARGKAVYCDNYRNLFYEKGRNGEQLALISRAHADARAGPSRGNPTQDNTDGKAAPFHGYLYLEDPLLAERGDWSENFALVAYPEKPGKTGNHIFWIDVAGDVLETRVPKTRPAGKLLEASESPLAEKPALPWGPL